MANYLYFKRSPWTCSIIHFGYVFIMYIVPHMDETWSLFTYLFPFFSFLFFLTFSINHIRTMKLSCIHQKASNVNENNVTL